MKMNGLLRYIGFLLQMLLYVFKVDQHGPVCDFRLVLTKRLDNALMVLNGLFYDPRQRGCTFAAGFSKAAQATHKALQQWIACRIGNNLV
jgi:hypothetical protein